MQMVLKNISKTVGGEVWLHPLDLPLRSRAVTVLLGATQAGKTSLMRIMAGLDVPTEGVIEVDGRDVTGVPVRERNVAMVYQQFINYPSMTVARNIASPLLLRGESDVAQRVRELAAKMHIEPFLERLPAELSGGQQQRVALARALAKRAPLMLLDEPLVNLDYKLREELREDLSALFAQGESTVVYATTEPSEALLLGGYTAVLDQGELLQYGPTVEVFHRPQSLRVAKAFSDPPMNLLAGQLTPAGLRLADGTLMALPLPPSTSPQVTVGLRAGWLSPDPVPGGVTLRGRVDLVEISGSDTFVHVQAEVGALVAQLSGVHGYDMGQDIQLHFSPDHVHVFDQAGALQLAPLSWREH